MGKGRLPPWFQDVCPTPTLHMEVEPFVHCVEGTCHCSYTGTFTHSPFYLWDTPLILSGTHRFYVMVLACTMSLKPCLFHQWSLQPLTPKLFQQPLQRLPPLASTHHYGNEFAHEFKSLFQSPSKVPYVPFHQKQLNSLVWHSEPFDSFPNLHVEASKLQLVNTLF